MSGDEDSCEICDNAGLFMYKVDGLMKAVGELQKDVRSLNDNIKNGAIGACALLIAAILAYIFK